MIGPLEPKTPYISTYSPNLLFPVPRSMARDKIGLRGPIPFGGVDIWTGFELGWLNSKGKPEIGLAEFRFPCTSPNVVESKSFKLYLNSFNQSHFDSHTHVHETLLRDLTAIVDAPIQITLTPHLTAASITTSDLPGRCIDKLDIEADIYYPQPTLLRTLPNHVEETLHTHLLKSNCLVTGQPDWGSVLFRYAGPQIDQTSLLRYIISYRNHSGFAEHCIEQIYHDILTHCRPTRLTVYGRYTRRGGLDINPFRSNFEAPTPENPRLIRQ